MDDEDVDFAIAAYHEEGSWRVVELHPSLGHDVEQLSEALARFPSDVGVLGMVSLDDDFFAIVRRTGTQLRAMLSDVTAALDWPIAEALVEQLELGDPDENDEPMPGGDLEIIADLGVSALDLRSMCDDDDLYPEGILTDVAERLGFADEFEAILE